MKIKLKEYPSFTLYLGRQGENKVKQIEFDFSDFVEQFGIGGLSLIVKRPVDSDPYPVAMDVTGNVATWLISDVDTAVVGQGEAQLIYSVNDKVKKTVILKTKVDPSLAPASEDVPDPYQNWLDDLAEIGGQIVADKNQALDEIDSAKTDALGDISDSKTDAVETIAEDKSDALQSIQTLKDSSLQALSTSKSNALQAIATSKTGALQVLSDDKNVALQAIATDKASALQAIDTVSNEALQDIDAEKSSAIQIMDEKVDEATQSAEDAAEFARRAEGYAENLHFRDSSDGNIVISIGG